MSSTEVQWIAPTPLWESILDSGTAAIFGQPALLRFASDNFMNDFTTLLQTNPGKLKDLRTRHETWRGPDTPTAVDPVDRLPKFAQKLYRSRLIAQKSAAMIEPMARRSARPAQPVKLYQPAHQRYYLVSAGLVCQVPGQPDRRIETSDMERVSFVVRKVTAAADTSIMSNHPNTWTEYAFVNNSWLKLDANSQRALAVSEEQNPLFAMTYTDDSGHRRRVLAGLVPVGKRESYIAAPQRAKDQSIVLEPGQQPAPDPRTLLFMANVTEPWKRLIERAFAIRKLLHPEDTPLTNDEPIDDEALDKLLKDGREQIQTTSWYVLLDFAKLLRQYMPKVWGNILGQVPSSQLSSGELSLVSTLTDTKILEEHKDTLLQPPYETPPDWRPLSLSPVVPSTVILNLREALREYADALAFAQSGPAPEGSLERKLEDVTKPYDRNASAPPTEWPDFLFPLADPDANLTPLPPPVVPPIPDEKDELSAALEQIDHLANLIENALPPQTTENVPPALIAAQPVLGIDTPTYFVIRCVFERPNCGPLQPTVVSEPTEPFLMAGFFDPDAPARPLRINLPVDTTPAGLRKFDKNTAFMISDILCGQIERAKGLGLGDLIRTVLPWPLHKDLDLPDKGPCVDGGMICSLSIPIITICALILLMIIVSLLDIIFRWMPFFIMCLPLPKFSGKPAST